MTRPSRCFPLLLAALFAATLFLSPRLSAADGTKEQDIREFLVAAGIWDQIQQMKSIMMKGFARQAEALVKNKNVPEGFWDEFYNNILTDEDLQSLVDRMIPIYDRYFSREEIRELTAVYQKDVFRKWVRLTPEMMQEGAKVGGEWGRQLAQSDTFQKRIEELLTKYNLK